MPAPARHAAPHPLHTPDALAAPALPTVPPSPRSPRSGGVPARSAWTSFLVAGLLVLAACEREPTPVGGSSPEPHAPAASAPAAAAPAAASAPTAWVTPRSANGAVLLEAPAKVLASPSTRAAVAAPFSARVSKIHVRPGETVEKGQVLLEVLMPEVVRAAGLSVAASIRVQAYERQRTQLLALREQGMVRLPELAEAETRLAEARADQQAAAAVLRVAGLEPRDAGAIARTGVVALESPIAGTVVELQASIGEVAGGDGPPLVRIAAAGGAGRIEARLSRTPPEGARFEYAPPQGPPVPVRLVGRAPQVDPRDATLSAWFEPEPGGSPLLAGQSGRLRVQAGPGAGEFTVPSRAITFREGHPNVLVRVEGATEPKPLAVEVLMVTGTEALVRGEGLGADTQVAANASAFEQVGPGHD